MHAIQYNATCLQPELKFVAVVRPMHFQILLQDWTYLCPSVAILTVAILKINFYQMKYMGRIQYLLLVSR